MYKVSFSTFTDLNYEGSEMVVQDTQWSAKLNFTKLERAVRLIVARRLDDSFLYALSPFTLLQSFNGG
jgi:hypothetical protein